MEPTYISYTFPQIGLFPYIYNKNMFPIPESETQFCITNMLFPSHTKIVSHIFDVLRF